MARPSRRHAGTWPRQPRPSPPGYPTTWCLPPSIVLDKLPLTPNGKMDRAALPAPAGPPVPWPTSRDHPGRGTPCAGFAEVLGLDQVGPEDNFFELGGHSLLAIQLLERLRVRGVHISMPAMIAAPTQPGWITGVSLSSVKEALSVRFQYELGEPSHRSSAYIRPVVLAGYMPLARHVPPEQPLYGLQASGLDGTSELACTLTDMAAHYIEQIRAVQRTGPYICSDGPSAGWSRMRSPYSSNSRGSG